MSVDTVQSTRIGYCTNVHAGRTLAETLAQIDRHAVAVRREVAPVGWLNIGLWLSAAAAAELDTPAAVETLRNWLESRRLRIFTMNGFPYGDFHGDVVKHAVYEPSWSDPDRLEYTLRLARLLVALVDEDGEAGISTLPLGWPAPPCKPVDLSAAVAQLRTAAVALDRIEADTGTLIHLDIEPEPGCILSTSSDLCRFFLDRLLLGVCEPEERIIRRHIRVCHDICHAAVMFEPQDKVMTRYDAAGIAVGKVQVSSAIDVHLPADESLRQPLIGALRPFAEDRYLHQTSTRGGSQAFFFEDLPAALRRRASGGEENWRVHYHVPISTATIGMLSTTQSEVLECLRLLAHREVCDLEVETYTWEVLPPAVRPDSIAEGISGEMMWLRSELDRLGIQHEGAS